MLLSHEPPVQYGRNPLLEVICQIRFPAILKLDTDTPSLYQDLIRRDFPRYVARRDQPMPKLVGANTPNPTVQPAQAVTNHHFVSADGKWKINLTQNFFSLSTMHYTTWEEFARRLDAPFGKFIQIYEPAFFERIGLRYLNAISRDALELGETPWRDLIEPHLLGALALEDVPETATRKATTDLEVLLPGGCNLKLHAGPGMVKRPGLPDEKGTRFILDNDFYVTGNLNASQVAGSLQTLHDYAWRTFRGAITDELHDALEPM